ncbi:MAG: hypothetical protein A2X13_04440 [Bacteroidetes bacterium GWC2_33_15]|nr:MAG: hypothetical protein A2X10_06285 [Bacteroidetes bacterium GWA2_33_15]OFX49780.1 MAG: hypothetical protein A2X13_04440 [Bacteroidetes bacterium GWC2_33_15]OFX64971.1 MAG: hypothetical protein A2X15_06360 [Bacteroidetes bacterium GWB2_32_14]OFX69067.1 MAG: hypothetical protein A2X14_13795 [Bacteroidetes bacterium GWD2_33_33]HAN18337.1 hypothetical protein [Bacteroidales bacterium]
MELYQQLGFSNNPFSTFSAEEEKSFLNDIYINPLFYETLKSDLLSGHSRFILGARGIGKTALILQLRNALDKDGAFTIIIDEFDGVSLKNNQVELTRLIIERVITNFCIKIAKDPKGLKKLDKYQKEKLSFIIKEFFQTLSKSQYEKLYNKTDNIRTRNTLKNIWNNFFNKPINFLISGGIEIVAETARKSMGLPSIDGKEFYKNYVPELTIEQIEREKKPEKFLSNIKPLKEILNDLTEIIHAAGFKTSIVFFDKIDEYTKLNGGISAVSDFLSAFLKDTTILMNKSYSLVFSLWDVLKPELTNNGVRFDKIKPIDITWQTDNLREILNKRIRFFSGGKKVINDIILSDNKLNEIITLSNNSPRYLFRQLSYIYDQQAEINKVSKVLTDEAIDKGQLVFSKSFEYYAIYPTKRGAKEDILTNINRLLKIGKTTIMTKDFVDAYKVSTPTAISYIKIVQEYNLVRELTETDGGAKMYDVLDPVLRHLIKYGITEIKK